MYSNKNWLKNKLKTAESPANVLYHKALMSGMGAQLLEVGGYPIDREEILTNLDWNERLK